jgi:hypothetical protein
MIDSLNIDLGHNFEVSDNSLLVIQRDTTSGFGEHAVRDYGLWVSRSKGVVCGRRAYFRRTGMLRFDIDIKIWKDGKRHCLVKFSVPELLHGSNALPAHVDELPLALDALQQELSQVGIKANIKQGQIVRIDLARQAAMVDNFSSYARVLRRIHVPGTDLKEHDTTLLWLHRQGKWAINAYDKTVQAGKSLQDGSGILRLELQLRTRRTVERILGYSSIKDLLDNAEHLQDVYRTFLHRRLPIGSFLQNSGGEGDLVNRIEQLVMQHKAKGGERWTSGALERIGLAYICKELGIEHAISLLAPTGPGASSTQRSRHSRLLKKARLSVFDLEQSVGEECGRTEIVKSLKRIINGSSG